ncbi:hypothetical protein [Nocardioides sp.]|uniref:hypothetical protein n=1 Tax=Nocardioides sp. TaxID=35761 RepID=UPI00286E9236|nr:hypothetical protein [Nocardioides sp.]
MQSRANLKRAIVAVVIGVLIGGGITAISPAGAEVSQFAATNWKKIWKKKLQPLADKRYYTKAASDAKYAAAGSAYSKAEVDAKLGGYYTKAQSDAKYQPTGNYALNGSSYTKAESDARYAPAQPLYRGTIMLQGNAAAPGAGGGTGISFGATFAAPPTPHYIKLGDPVPVGCSGTAAAPNAAAGNLCVFESEAVGVGANRGICRGGVALCSATDAFGAGVYTFSAGTGIWEVLATWAARPTGVVNPSFAPSKPGAVNGAGAGGQAASTR